MSRLTENFTSEEMACNCGCGEGTMDASFMEALQNARRIFQQPMVITSGFRCEQHNRDVGGTPDSAHLRGKAADIKTSGSRERFLLVDALRISGFTRIGMANSFTHADNDSDLPHLVIWLY